MTFTFTTSGPEKVKMKKSRSLPFMCPLAVLLALWVNAANAAGQDASDAIREHVERHQLSRQLALAGADIAGLDVFWRLYENNNYAPLWPEQERIDVLIDMVGRAEEEGLLPRDYHHETLLRLRRSNPRKAEDVADFDMLLTDSLMRYLYHRYFGKVNPADLDSDWNLSRRLDQDPLELIAGTMAAADMQQHIVEVLDWGPYYQRMKLLLADYRTRAASEGGGYPAVPSGETLRRGMHDPRITLLRARLQASNHLTAGSPDDPEYFDAELERAVKRFQTEAEIDVDGAVGAGTLAALNVSLQSRIDQIRVNMERARWILRDIKGTDNFVVVNIADFKTMLVRDGDLAWQTRSQVGRTYRKTPIFRSNMKYVQFNPTWTIPPGILRRDTLPKLKADAEGYLAEKNMKLVDNSTGREVDPATIDWAGVTSRNFRYQVVQRPGPDNALGRAKFIFPNPHYVFLHDTNHREHFDDKVRTFSSGCIRIEHPLEFARLVLDDEQWDDAAIQNVIDSKQTKTVYLKEPLPVLVLYWTVNPITEGGRPEFLADVYDRDGRVLKALGEPFRVVPPDNASDWLE
jgi:murein L,D-transpeptidase YcbB/YkuD